MKLKQRIIFFGMVAVALILASCDGDSGNNSSETEGGSSSSIEFSSSSEQISSSSVVESSSSSVGVSSSSVAVCSNTYGTSTVTDCRDGQTYRTVVIGTQTWMAENLDYVVDSSWCYNNSADSCSKYGRLYQWAAAMNIDAAYNYATWGGSDVNHQGACPSGWHIPTDDEWTTLENAVGGSSMAGTVLKSASGWYDSGNGMGAYGFSILPAGYRSYDGSFLSAGDYALFWSATEGDASSAYYRFLGCDYEDMYTDDVYKTLTFSVRCVKDL